MAASTELTCVYMYISELCDSRVGVLATQSVGTHTHFACRSGVSGRASANSGRAARYPTFITVSMCVSVYAYVAQKQSCICTYSTARISVLTRYHAVCAYTVSCSLCLHGIMQSVLTRYHAVRAYTVSCSSCLHGIMQSVLTRYHAVCAYAVSCSFFLISSSWFIPLCACICASFKHTITLARACSVCSLFSK